MTGDFKTQRSVFPLLMVFFIAFGSLLVSGQSEIIDSNRTSNCEYAAAIVDSFLSGIDSGKDIIVVSYKGKTESKENVAMSRAKYIKAYFSNYHKGTPLYRPADRVVAALGLEEKKEGEVRIYVDGKPRLILFFKDNRALRLSPC